MDSACSIRQPNVFHSGQVSVYGSSSSSKLRFRGFNNHMRIASKAQCVKTTKRSTGYCLNSALTFRNGSDKQSASLFYNFHTVSKVRTGVKSYCLGNDSLSYVDGNGRNVESVASGDESDSGGESNRLGEEEEVEERGEKEEEDLTVDELRGILQNALKELEVARINSTMFEEKAQKVSETAIGLKDEAANAWNAVNSTLDKIQEIVAEESLAKEAVQKATMALSLAEARLRLAVETLEAEKETDDASRKEEEAAVLAAEADVQECLANLANCDAEVKRLQENKEEIEREVEKLNEVAETAQMNALKAEEEVANIMLLAEQAVAFEVEATQCVNDAEIALHKKEKSLSSSSVDVQEHTLAQALGEEIVLMGDIMDDVGIEAEKSVPFNGDAVLGEPLFEVKSEESPELSDHENGRLGSDSNENGAQKKKQETQKDLTKESSAPNSTKSLQKKSSRFFSASFFSFTVAGTELTPASVFHSLVDSVKKQIPTLVFGLVLFGGGADRSAQLFPQPDAITTSMEEVSSTAKPLIRVLRKLPKRIKKLIAMIPQQEVNEEEASLFDMLWLLLASVIFVPIFQKIPGGSPVLGYLAAGILIGPYGLSIIRHVHGTKAIAEFGVVFLLFNIGLELSVERLSSMKKYVFGLGSAQVLVTAVVIGLGAHILAGLPGPASIVLGNGLALSSTAVVLQVLQERGESTSRHGRATFSVLLFQDLAVVVLLILIPLISPNSSKGGVGFQAIAEALGLAAIKAAVAITAIIAGGRLLLRPIYKQIAENQNAEIFSANTLLVILGTSLLTARAGLSMALGAFLAGLLLAETEFSLQVESDIAPYRGLLLGLFFMTVGMSIDPKLLLSNFPVIMGNLGLLIVGKGLLVAVVGRIFGLSIISALRTGLLLAPGGEFAFVAFGEAVNQGIMSPRLSSLMFLVVGISMAITPWLAAGGQLIASRFEQQDVRSLLPDENETDDLQDHIIICGFGRVGQIVAQLLSERLIPFVALDVRSDRVAIGRALDLPVYFGDAGSQEVLHKIGAGRACAAAITLDTPGANYRTVWALSKYFPNVKTFVRAHDVDHGLNLEKAGATAVVPETLEPSLQLAAAVLAQAKLPMPEIAATINEFRSRHLSELTELCETSGSSLGYGFSRIMAKTKSPSSESSDESDPVSEGTLAI
ncbi:hypothetical protein ACFE04_026488 [Oxalis oulophora]